MTIKEVEQLLEVPRATIRFYEKENLRVEFYSKPDTESVFTTAPASGDGLITEKPELSLDVTVEGTTANVKMLTKNFEFLPISTETGEQLIHGQGHAHVYLNGQLKGKVDEAEFLLKQLPKGEHELRVELAYNNHLPYKVEQVRMIQVK